MKYGFVKVAAAIPAVKVADCKFNAQQIDTQIAIADGKGVQIIVFPELCITGYTCADLFFQKTLLERAVDGLNAICAYTCSFSQLTVAVGVPFVIHGVLVVNIQHDAAHVLLVDLDAVKNDAVIGIQFDVQVVAVLLEVRNTSIENLRPLSRKQNVADARFKHSRAVLSNEVSGGNAALLEMQDVIPKNLRLSNAQKVV